MSTFEHETLRAKLKNGEEVVVKYDGERNINEGIFLEKAGHQDLGDIEEISLELCDERFMVGIIDVVLERPQHLRVVRFSNMGDEITILSFLHVPNLEYVIMEDATHINNLYISPRFYQYGSILGPRGQKYKNIGDIHVYY